MTLFFGWQLDQWAYAYQRFKMYENRPRPQSIDGLVELRDWWRRHPWPDPAPGLIVGAHGSDMEWAAPAFAAAIGGLCL